jgi:hypothetical protein
MIKTIVINTYKRKVFCGVCNPPLQTDNSPISRNAETIMVSVNLLKEVFEGLTLLTNHLAFCMKILNTKNFLVFTLKQAHYLLNVSLLLRE